MKIRRGFVSNSSSASFCCEVCDECYDPDHSPLVAGGLCVKCHKEYEICNCCGKLDKKDNLFETRYEDLERGECVDDEDGEHCTIWMTNMTCADCLIRSDDLIDAWAKAGDHTQYIKKISDPSSMLSKLDQKLVKALLGRKS